MNYEEEINRLKQDIAALRSGGNGWNRFPPLAEFRNRGQPALLQTPIIAAGVWEGQSYSTTAKTLIDLSAVFGLPKNITKVEFGVAIRDSGSAANDCRLILSPTDTNNAGKAIRCYGLPNDDWTNSNPTINCNIDGNIYYQIYASGVNTMDIYLQVHDYYTKP